MQGKHKCQIITAIFIAALSVLFVRKAQALEYQNSVDVQFTFNPYISLTVSGDLVINDLAPGSSADSNIITITASSNSPAGYALYSSVGSSTYNYTDLRLSSSNTTNVFTNLSSNVASLSNFSDNTWGYSYSTDSGTTWQSGDADSTPASGYNGLPLYNAITYTDLETSETINTGIKLANAVKNATTEVQFKIGAKASSTQATGTYTNVVNFINVAKVLTTNYTLSYVDNSGEATNMPATATGTTTSGAVTLPTNVPTLEGYIFKGWCDVDNSSDPTACSDGTNTGTTTQPGGIYALNTTSNSATVNLYAYWSKLPYSSCPNSPMISTVASGITYMQDITSSNSATVLSALTTNNTYQIKDNRDNETYCVAKLADGKLWMLDNLALDLTDSTILNNLSSDNTNASTGLPYLKGDSTRDPNTDANGQYATAAVSNWTSSLSYSAPLVNITDKYVVPTDATSRAGGYKVGGYYNYCAASAGSYCYGNGTSQGTSSGNVTEDICPAGWRMPTVNTSGEFSALANAIYGSTSSTSDAIAYANYRSALHLPLSGNFLSGSASNQGSSGYWWSSTRGNNDVMPNLGVNTSTINPANTSSRLVGSSLRCVAGN